MEPKKIRDDINRVRLYCHQCGKICSNLLPKEKIKSWLENPLCIDCCIENMKKNNGQKMGYV